MPSELEKRDTVAPLHWSFVFVGWTTLGVFGVVLIILTRIHALLGREGVALLTDASESDGPPIDKLDVFIDRNLKLVHGVKDLLQSSWSRAFTTVTRADQTPATEWNRELERTDTETTTESHSDQSMVKERAEREFKEPPSEKKEPSEDRWLEASLEGGPLKQGEKLTLYAQLVVNASSTAHVVTAKAHIKPGIGHVTFTCQAEGFKLKTTWKMTLDIFPGVDTDMASFTFEVLPAKRYRITVSAYQEGTLCGQVVVEDFTSLKPAPASPLLITTQDRKRESYKQRECRPELTLEFAGPNEEITASSPKEVFDWNAKNLGKWQPGTGEALNNARERFRRLYDCEDKAEVDREFRALGREIAKAMPEELIRALSDAKVRNLFVQAPVDFDFPIEYALLESRDPKEQWLLQDRVAISRWFVNAKALPTISEPNIHKIALAIGQMEEDSSIEIDVFKPLGLPDGRIVRFGTAKGVTASVFGTGDYRMFHYFGHLKCDEDDTFNDVYFTFADDNSVIKVRNIGVDLKDQAFFESGPVIVLNCCESAGEVKLIVGRESLPHRFIDFNALACVATLGEVES